MMNHFLYSILYVLAAVGVTTVSAAPFEDFENAPEKDWTRIDGKYWRLIDRGDISPGKAVTRVLYATSKVFERPVQLRSNRTCKISGPFDFAVSFALAAKTDAPLHGRMDMEFYDAAGKLLRRSEYPLQRGAPAEYVRTVGHVTPPEGAVSFRPILCVVSSGPLKETSFARFDDLEFDKVIAQEKAKPSALPAAKLSDYKFDFKVDRADGICRIGETVTFSGNATLKGKPLSGTMAECMLVRNYSPRIISTQKVKLSDKPISVSYKADKPGWVRLMVTILDEKGKPVQLPDWQKYKRKVSGGVGIMVEPETIRPGGTEPADFDTFWADRRAELDKVPMNPRLTPVEVPENMRDKVVCYDVLLDCAGGKPVSGYLCMPKYAEKGKHPAMGVYHGAGVRSAKLELEAAAGGFIVFNINAHGIPNGKPDKYYTDLANGELFRYQRIGQRDHHKLYYIGMYQRVMRSLDYLKSRPEWDGKTLIVMGGSQGGAQSVAGAALDKQVTHCFARVPAFCDVGGGYLGRAVGWPLYAAPKADGQLTDDQKLIVRETSYIDGAFFARRIHAVSYWATGFMDNTCHPDGVYAAYNSLPDGIEKHISVTPAAGHEAKDAYCEAWLKKVYDAYNAHAKGKK